MELICSLLILAASEVFRTATGASGPEVAYYTMFIVGSLYGLQLQRNMPVRDEG